MSLEQNGYLTIEELKAAGQYPSDERMNKGPIAIAECTHNIPCNPCESACRYNAISIGENITELPRISGEKCIGCGLCIAKCSGLAIFVINKTYSDTEGTVSFPYEYTPLPEKGKEIQAVNRRGEVVCPGTVVKIMNPKSYDRTPVITVAVSKDKVEDVRSIKRLQQ